MDNRTFIEPYIASNGDKILENGMTINEVYNRLKITRNYGNLFSFQIFNEKMRAAQQNALRKKK